MHPHVVVDSATGKRALWAKSSYASERAAKAARTRLTRLYQTRNQPSIDMVIWPLEQFNLINDCRMKTVINLITKQPVVIHEDTPLCCDPSSETYWSM